MSLLMNALKKAEKAKQSGQPGAETAAGTESNRNLAQELGLDPPSGHGTASGVAASPALASASEPSLVPLKEMELALAPELDSPAPPLAEAAVRAPGRAASRPTGSTDRGSARAVFSAKNAPKVNSKKPFYTLVGVSLVATVGYGVYLWMQVSLPARPITAAAAPVPASPASPPPSGKSTAGTEPLSPAPLGTGSGIAFSEPSAAAPPPQLPKGSDGDGPAPAQNGTTARGGEQNAERPASVAVRRAPRGQRDAASAVGGAGIESPASLRIARNTSVATVNPDVLAGYTALQAGDLDRAGQAYDRALRSEPSNRDAMLGAATVLLRLERTDAAEAYFRQLLRLHPNDTYATAQLAALTARGDPIGALSQVNSLIARETERSESASGSGALAFVQGNQLAAQSRWPEAQQAYFNAHRADPGNADYCYNLAISLDRIREPRLARDFYRKAIELSRGRVAGFDLARAQLRLDQIEGSLK